MRGKDARELPPQSIAFSGQKSDNGVLESKKEVTTRRRRTMLRKAYQSLVEEINGFYRGLRKQRGEWAPLADGQRSDVVARSAGCDAVELL